MLLQRRSPRRVAAPAAVALAAVSAAALLLARAWLGARTAAGRPPALTLAGTCLEACEAACCLLLAWAVWRER